MIIIRADKIKASTETYFEISWCSTTNNKGGFKIYASKKWANKKISKLMKQGIDSVHFIERESRFDVLQKELTFHHFDLN
jgi:hypothetical protein